MVEMDGEKLMVSSSNFDDGSMIVSVGTTDFNNYGDSDFMEIMINKDGKIDYFTLPVGKDDYQRMYKIKPSHYGTMKTQNETNESAGGDFIRTDGDGKYAESFGAESFSSKLARYGDGKRVINKKNKEKGVMKVTERKVMWGGIDMGIKTSYEVYYDKGTHYYTDNFTTLIRNFTPLDDEKNAESFGAEDIDDYIQRIFTFIDEKVGTEYFGSIEDEEEVIRFKQAFMDKFNEIEEPPIIDWNEIFSAESFGAEMKLPKLTKKQMDLLRYSKWFQTYSAYAKGQSEGYWSPEDWKDGKAEKCFTITSDGWGNENIARRTLKSLLEKKVLYATKTNYFDYDGRIRKSPAQQVNENPDLVSELTSVCLGLTPIGVEIIKREFARQVKDVVGWRIELTLEDGQTAYLSDMPDDISQSIDNHIEEVKWDVEGEQFGAEPVEWDEWIGEQCQNCKKGPMYEIVEVEEESGEEHYATKCKSCDYQTIWYAETLKAESFGAETPCAVMVLKDGVLTECGWWNENNEPCVYHPDGKEIKAESFGAESFEDFKRIIFGAELLDYPHPMSDRQKHRIRKLGGRIDKAMSRSQASQYIKSLMRIEPLHAETHALDCSACQGWGWNEDLNMVCDADGCIGGWIVPKKPSLLERGLELGAGVGMGVAGVAILFGVLGGTVGFAAEEMKKRRD